jgi:hypothetical protein
MLGQSTAPATDESAMEEAVQGRSWWKTCCTGCCLGLIVLGVVIFFGFRLLWGSGPRTVTRIPDTFPTQLVLFRPEEVREIMYYPGADKGTATQLIAGPLAWLEQAISSAGGSASGTAQSIGGNVQSRLRQLEGRDTVAMRWENVNASRDEIIRHYAGALRQVGILSPQMRRDPAGLFDEMTGKTNNLSFSLLVDDDPAKTGIDHVSVVVEYAVSK